LRLPGTPADERMKTILKQSSGAALTFQIYVLLIYDWISDAKEWRMEKFNISSFAERSQSESAMCAPQGD